MDAYWLAEYGKVFGGYVFLMFIWPLTVFRRYLKSKSKTYCFCFCVTVQIVMVNTVVLMMGLFHILDRRVVACIFYGVFFASLWKEKALREFCIVLIGRNKGKQKQLQSYREELKIRFQSMWKGIYPKILEYVLLLILIVFGMMYFSYAAFQIHSYGQYDLLLHHKWVHELLAGVIFPEGIYPEAMHCFIYCMNALFGIRIYSVILFLQCIHIVVFLLSGFFLLKEVFYWRFSPFFVLGLFLTIDFIFDHSMARMQTTLPMEFGMYTQFLCALFLLQYLKKKGMECRRKALGCYWDDNLLLFAAALAASIAVHYYVTIMVFIVCACFALFHLRKMVCYRYFIPLAVSAFFGCMVAFLPMAGALAAGSSFEPSISWGLSYLNQNAKGEKADVDMEKDSPKTAQGALDLTSGDIRIIEKLPGIGQKIVKPLIKAEYFMRAIYNHGYKAMYFDKKGGKRGSNIFWITLVVVLLCFVGKYKDFGNIGKFSRGYPPIILVSFLAMVIFAAYDSQYLGLPVLIADHRFCVPGHLMTLAVMIMPADIIISIAAQSYRDKTLQIISFVATISIYIFVNVFDIYHRYLFYVMLRYDVTALVTNSIIEEFPKGSYTVVSPWEDTYQVAPYGRHENITDFLEKCSDEDYSLSTEYVFIYVEKKPFSYFQYYYLSGPSWLGKSINMKIKNMDLTEIISQERAGEDVNALYGKRMVSEVRIYEWCQDFSQLYPSKLKVLYEDEEFVCYYFEQDINKPFHLGLYAY